MVGRGADSRACVKGELWEVQVLLRHAMIWWSWKEKENCKCTGAHNKANLYYCLPEIYSKLYYDIHPQEYSSLKEHSQLNNSLQSIVDASKGYYQMETVHFEHLANN